MIDPLFKRAPGYIWALFLAGLFVPVVVIVVLIGAQYMGMPIADRSAKILMLFVPLGFGAALLAISTYGLWLNSLIKAQDGKVFYALSRYGTSSEDNSYLYSQIINAGYFIVGAGLFGFGLFLAGKVF